MHSSDVVGLKSSSCCHGRGSKDGEVYSWLRENVIGPSLSLLNVAEDPGPMLRWCILLMIIVMLRRRHTHTSTKSILVLEGV